MRLLCAGAAAALLACGTAGFADTVGDCDHPIEAPLRARAALVIEARPAGVEIVGTDAEVVRVSCTAENSAMDVELRISGTPGYGRLNVTSPVKNQNLKIRIEVPKKTNLRFHMGAGEVDVKDVVGDKDIDLYAGQITIASASSGSYKSVEASVDIGEVNASAYGVDKGGFFRTFRKTIADGEYRLRAHVMTGEIDLQ
jgi:hypothetical protein